MAMGSHFVCSSCDGTLEAWDEGNPYYFDDRGVKHYAYHPDHENLDRCVGNDPSHICLSCGNKFIGNSESPLKRCPACGASDVSDPLQLEGMKCPLCKRGMIRDSGHRAIS